jgi:hypothetical protein
MLFYIAVPLRNYISSVIDECVWSIGWMILTKTAEVLDENCPNVTLPIEIPRGLA